MNTPLLSVDNLTIGFPNATNTVTPVVRDVNLHIEPSMRIGIVGESGCGKSTLAYALLGMLRGTGVRVHGSVTYAGAQLFTMTSTQLQRIRGAEIALVPQNAGQSLAPHRTVYAQIAEVLEIHQHMHGDTVWQRVMQLLTDMRVRNPAQVARRYPHQLSGGQQQRVALAMALAGQPKLLVLDEPTTGLDVTTQAQLLALLHALTTNTAMAVVLVSHDLGVIAQMCQQVVVMYAGEVVEMGETDYVFQHPYHPYTRGLIAAMPQLTVPSLPYAMPGQMRRVAIDQSCAFRDRCAFAQSMCASTAPTLAFVEHTHAVRCHYWQTVVTHDDVGNTPTHVLDGTPADAFAPLLEVHQVSATYQQPDWRWWVRTPAPMVVSQVDVTLTPGHTCAVVGESGSGKSTLARVMTGLHQPVTGGVYLEKTLLPTMLTQRSQTVRRRIQLIFQNPDLSLNPRHTVFELLYRPQAVFFGRTRAQARPHTMSMLQQMRLDESYLTRLPQQLSGGEKQRVAIARAFLADPDVVVCDEVVSALDVSVQATLLQLLVDIQRQRGTTYLFIAHDLAVVRVVAHTVIVLFAGHVCEQGATADVFAVPHHPYTMLLISAVLTVPRRHNPLPMDIATDTAQAHGGCPFRNRCPIAIPQQCANVVPPWQQVTESHAFRCHHTPEVLASLREQLALPITQRRNP